MKSYHNNHLNKLVLAGLALAATMAAVAPATSAHAEMITPEVRTTTAPSVTVTTTEPASTIIDRSTPGTKLKALIHCVDLYTKAEMQTVLVDTEYFRTLHGQAPEYQYAKPVIEGYSSAAYYKDGGKVPFTVTGEPVGTFEFTVEYNTLDASKFVIGWANENGTWFRKSAVGLVLKGWRQVDGEWYLLDNTTGAMKTGWVKDNGTWYYMYSTGQMASNTTINGYTLDSTGACQ